MDDGPTPQDSLDPASSPRRPTNLVALGIILGLVVVVVVGAILTWGAIVRSVEAFDESADAGATSQESRSPGTAETDDGATAGEAVTGTPGAPAGANADGGIVVGVDGVGRYTAGAPVVQVYSDYLCPYCARFEAANGAMLEDLRASGQVTVVYHPVAFLDRFSDGTRYSTRAAQAVAVVADAAPASFTAFHAALLAEQPAENTPGLTDDRIAQVALTAGVPKDVAGTFIEGRFTEWVGTASQRAVTDAGVPGTPTIVVDGEVFEGDWRDPSALRAAILAAAG